MFSCYANGNYFPKLPKLKSGQMCWKEGGNARAWVAVGTFLEEWGCRWEIRMRGVMGVGAGRVGIYCRYVGSKSVALLLR